MTEFQYGYFVGTVCYMHCEKCGFVYKKREYVIKI